MLQTISWKQYMMTMGLGTVLYYGWWLVRYYPGWKGRGWKAITRPAKGTMRVPVGNVVQTGERTAGIRSEGGISEDGVDDGSGKDGTDGRG